MFFLKQSPVIFKASLLRCKQKKKKLKKLRSKKLEKIKKIYLFSLILKRGSLVPLSVVFLFCST